MKKLIDVLAVIGGLLTLVVLVIAFVKAIKEDKASCNYECEGCIGLGC